MIDKILSKVTAFTNNKYMRILTNSFMGVTAVTICGSIFTLVKSIPFDPWIQFLSSSGLGDVLSIPVSITTDIIALYLVFAIGYFTTKAFQKDAFGGALVALGAFLLLTPFSTVIYNADYTVATPVSGVIPVSSVGAQGMFLAIIAGLVSARLYVFCLDKNWKIKMPDSVPPNVSSMFERMIPGGIVFIVFLIIRYGMSLTPFGTAQTCIYGLLQAPLTNVSGGLIGAIIFLLVGQALWLLGIHGTMVTYVAMSPIMGVMNAENLSAFAAGTPAPHPEWAILMLVIIGGSGATLALNMLMCSKLCKSEQYKSIGKLSILPSLFNINEPLIFGTPLIMNPIAAIPFIFTSVINLLICVLLYHIGFFIPTGATISNFMPFFVAGGLLTSNWQGIVTFILLIVIDLAIWFPFFKTMDNKVYKEEQERLANKVNE